MPEIEVENRKETGIWKFETTPRMSSYLLAFVAGDLQGVTAKTKTVPSLVFTQPKPTHHLTLILTRYCRSLNRILRRLLWSQVSNPSITSHRPS